MEENRFWAYKVIQFLHDPPGKPFLFFPGSGGHRALARELWDMIFKEKPRFFSYADWIASGADRPVIKGLGTIYFHKNPLITHPLTKSHIKLTLPSEGKRVTLEEIDELKELQKSSLERLIEHIEGVEGNKTAFFNLWRLFRKELIKDDPDIPWRFIPADSRCPDHSIWEHNRLTSALAFITQGLVKKNGQPRDINDPDYPWLFSFSLRSPQSFLKEARKSQDLWTGSMLISDLVFAGMVPIIEHYGPDVVIYPDLLANPRADIWLCYGKENTISTEFKSQLKGAYSRASVIPHTFVAILPRGGEGHLKSIEDIGNEVLKAIGKRWGKYVSLAKNWMESKISLTKAKLWHDTWKAFQNTSPLEPIWIAVPWIPCERQDNYYFSGRTLPCQEIERPPKGDFEIIKRRFFKLGFWVPEEVWARYEYSRSVFARTKEEYYLNSGFNYSLLHYKLKAQHMLRKLYSALPETHKQNKENLDLSRKTKGMTEKCTLCKSRPVIADYKEEPGDHAESIRAKLKEFWSNTDLDPAGEGKERLCPVCATKRFEIVNESDKELETSTTYLFPMFGKSGSISAGMAFGHFKSRMGDLLEEARELLEDLAKDKAERDAVAVGHFSRSGSKTRFASKWQLKEHLTIEKVIEAVSQGFEKEIIPRSMPYKLKEYSKKLYKLELFKADIRHILQGLVSKCIDRNTVLGEIDLKEAVYLLWEKGLTLRLREPLDGIFFSKYLASRVAI